MGAITRSFVDFLGNYSKLKWLKTRALSRKLWFVEIIISYAFVDLDCNSHLLQ